MTEEQLHISVADYLRLRIPDVLWWATVNEGRHKPQYRAKMKRKGMKSGVPDLMFIIPPTGQAAFIELKAEGSRQTDTQKWFEHEAKASGADYEVCRSIEDVEEVLIEWGLL